MALRTHLSDPRYDRLWSVVAWAKRSGLSRIASSLQDYRARGGYAEIVIGVDEGGATVEGLTLALALFDQAFVFHDRGRRTFHPKLFVVEGDEEAVALIGSGNATKGGLFTNYEATLEVRMNLSVAEDARLLGELRNYHDRLRATGDACRELTEELIDQLQSDPAVDVQSEATQNRRRASGRRSTSTSPSIFGDPVPGLVGAPEPDIQPVESDDEDDDSSPRHLPPIQTELGLEPADELDDGARVTGFWKTLSRFDASHSSAPGQIVIPIRFLEFFGPLDLQVDETAAGGVRQSHTLLTVEFVDGGFRRTVPEARAVLYEPAASHPRPNKELRFTFHDREVFDRLSEGDILVFSRSAIGVRIERRPAGSMGSERFGDL